MAKRMTSFVVLIAFFSLTIPAQEAITQSILQHDKIDRSIYIELFGASNLIGISYDSRISPDSKLGYRIGISYMYGASSLFDGSHSNTVISFPLEANYLLGKNNSKLDVGIGINLGLYTEKNSYTEYSYITDDDVIIMIPTKEVNMHRKRFGYYLFSNIGYRYQANKGFLFRVGINPSFNFGDAHGIKKRPFLYPYISFGYSF